MSLRPSSPKDIAEVKRPVASILIQVQRHKYVVDIGEPDRVTVSIVNMLMTSGIVGLLRSSISGDASGEAYGWDRRGRRSRQ